MRTEKEVRDKITYLEEQLEDLKAEMDFDNWDLEMSLENDIILLQWVCGDLEL